MSKIGNWGKVVTPEGIAWSRSGVDLAAGKDFSVVGLYDPVNQKVLDTVLSEEQEITIKYEHVLHSYLFPLNKMWCCIDQDLTKEVKFRGYLAGFKPNSDEGVPQLDIAIVPTEPSCE